MINHNIHPFLRYMQLTHIKCTTQILPPTQCLLRNFQRKKKNILHVWDTGVARATKTMMGWSWSESLNPQTILAYIVLPIFLFKKMVDHILLIPTISPSRRNTECQSIPFQGSNNSACISTTQWVVYVTIKTASLLNSKQVHMCKYVCIRHPY